MTVGVGVGLPVYESVRVHECVSVSEVVLETVQLLVCVPEGVTEGRGEEDGVGGI